MPHEKIKPGYVASDVFGSVEGLENPGIEADIAILSRMGRVIAVGTDHIEAAHHDEVEIEEALSLVGGHPGKLIEGILMVLECFSNVLAEPLELFKDMVGQEERSPSEIVREIGKRALVRDLGNLLIIGGVLVEGEVAPLEFQLDPLLCVLSKTGLLA